MLIALAVIVGIVLLQIVDPGKTGPVGARTTNSTASTTTSTTAPKSSTTSTTKAAATPEKTAAQVHLLVLNAGAPTGSAGNVSTNLKNQGYTNQGTPADNATHITGEKVLCLPALTREAAKIVQLLGPGTASGPLAAPLPTGAAGFDCVVLVGSG
jgi:LytR cell envelope-related transcriptional attenuator